MSMSRKQWSVSALSVELGIDRRTLARRLERVKPAGQGAKGPVYWLEDALAAIDPAKRPTDDDGRDFALAYSGSTAHLGKRAPKLVTRTELREILQIDDAELETWLQFGCPFVPGRPLRFMPGVTFRWYGLMCGVLQAKGFLSASEMLPGRVLRELEAALEAERNAPRGVARA